MHLRQHGAAAVGQRHRLALPFEERTAQLGFERAHLLAHGRLRQRDAR
ncbi:hypothetical protein ACPWT1_18665 [Ramlibacter sp. MMS24-I3-19]